MLQHVFDINEFKKYGFMFIYYVIHVTGPMFTVVTTEGQTIGPLNLFIKMRHIVTTLKMVKNYFLGLLGHNLIFLDEILTEDGFQ